MDISAKLIEMGYDTVPAKFYENVNKWKWWYEGFVKDFHKYSVYNGVKRVECQKASAGMAKKAAEDWADLLMNEKVKITLEDEAAQEFFDDVCKANNFWRMMNQSQELCFALGTTAYVARVEGMTVNETGVMEEDAKAIKIDFVQADGIYPLSWENGRVTECAFATKRVINNKNLVYLQIHKLNESGTYDIENHLFDNKNDKMEETALTEVDEYANVPEVFHTNSEKPQFTVDRPNIVNNIDPTLPLGISVYANAIDQLKTVDNIYDSFNSEFVLGRKRVMVKAEAMQTIDGEPVFDENDLVFYQLPEDSTTDTFIQSIDSPIRAGDHLSGMQIALDVLSMKVGLGDNHWKFDAGNITTATQVMSANSEMFRTLKKHEIILEECLTDLVRTILHLGNEYMGQHFDEEVEMSIDFDDSIIEDKATDFQRDMAMLQAGILNPYEFRMTWMNEDEETAKAALPQMEELVSSEEAGQ